MTLAASCLLGPAAACTPETMPDPISRTSPTGTVAPGPATSGPGAAAIAPGTFPDPADCGPGDDPAARACREAALRGVLAAAADRVLRDGLVPGADPEAAVIAAATARAPDLLSAADPGAEALRALAAAALRQAIQGGARSP